MLVGEGLPLTVDVCIMENRQVSEVALLHMSSKSFSRFGGARWSAVRTASHEITDSKERYE